ncbi:putative mitochondrial protein [Cucumis melo var. makuwa]|uniref:Mitochondrial protein n=1 Tax=Cucumis melo var. makuwa TaxID=1194695 RepID=A0A5A7T1P5_CUCMM|nr:putative mitochondrial protein [Cucumis melo var. makuwa]
MLHQEQNIAKLDAYKEHHSPKVQHSIFKFHQGSFKCKTGDFTNASSISRIALLLFHIQVQSSKASLMLPHIQAPKLHRCFLKFKLEGFIDVSTYSSLKASLMLSHICNYASSSKCRCSKLYLISNMLQPRRSSSQICCSQEDCHLKYVAAEKIISNIAIEKIIISNMLQQRRSSSSIDGNTSWPPTLQMIMVQLRKDDNGAALPPPLQDDNNGTTLSPLLQDDDDGGVAPPPSLQDEDDSATLPPPLQKDDGTAPRRSRWGKSTSVSPR